MRIIPKKSSLRRSILLYRRLRHSRGHGVHSPFVFNLIQKVIREKGAFYRFQEIELLRRRLLQDDEVISYPDRRNKETLRRSTVADIVKREAIRPDRGALLFRLTNYFKPENILQIGPSMGLSTLYLTSYAPGLKCISLENIPEYATISQWVYHQAARTQVNLRIGDYRELLPGILREMGRLDFLFFNGRNEQKDMLWVFTACMQYRQDKSVFVCEGIHGSKQMHAFWKEICSLKEVTVTLDLYSVGIVFFNPKLHKRNYIVYY